ncbi:MAG: hypothetical protein WD009_07455 [Phycisphaeraceae bacterium]
MLVSGFTFIKNAVTLDYPVVEAIRAVLPLVDEFVVNVGRDLDDQLQPVPDDGTRALIESIDSPKIRIIESTWNPHTVTGGYVYAQQTDIALLNCRGVWAFYVQCDEVVHEEDHEILRQAMSRHADNPRVDALALQQLNFFGDYNTQVGVRPWRGRRRCWVVKPHHFVLSRGDAAGFTVHPKYKERGRKLRAVETPARQFHYNSVKSRKAFEAKLRNAAQYWSERALDVGAVTRDFYYQRMPRQFVTRFPGTHPAVMAERITQHPIELDHDAPQWRTTLTAAERRLLIKSKLIDLTTDRWTGRGSYRLVSGRRR